ncbi:MAG: hypothetical protein ACYTEQ_09970, partial [Planctomycetota bacterium]
QATPVVQDSVISYAIRLAQLIQGALQCLEGLTLVRPPVAGLSVNRKAVDACNFGTFLIFWPGKEPGDFAECQI